MPRVIRPPFDPRYEFVVVPPAGRAELAIAGKLLPAGQIFDKGLVDARRLQQMYAARLLAVAPGSKLPAGRAARPRAVGPSGPPGAADQAAAGGTPAGGTKTPRSMPRRRLERSEQAA